MNSSLPDMIARRIINDWMKACRDLAAKNKAAPMLSFARTDGRYVIMLQKLISEEIERLQSQASFIP